MFIWMKMRIFYINLHTDKHAVLHQNRLFICKKMRILYRRWNLHTYKHAVLHQKNTHQLCICIKMRIFIQINMPFYTKESASDIKDKEISLKGNELLVRYPHKNENVGIRRFNYFRIC